MVKKKRNLKKSVSIEPLEKLGSSLKQIFIMAAGHPATAGLAIMATTVALKLIFQPKEGSQRNAELTGMYNGAQAIAAGAVLAPVVVGAIGLASAIAKGEPSAAATRWGVPQPPE